MVILLTIRKKFIDDNKGIWDIMEAFKVNCDRWKGKIKLIVGGNGEVDKLKNIIKDNNLEELVEFRGWISGNDKIKAFIDADIYLQPSYKEALGIAILEAMSYSLPVIATNIGGIPSIVKDNETGLLIKPGDSKSLAEKIEILAESPDNAIKMGKKGRKIASSFNTESIKKQLLELYNTLK